MNVKVKIVKRKGNTYTYSTLNAIIALISNLNTYANLNYNKKRLEFVYEKNSGANKQLNQ